MMAASAALGVMAFMKAALGVRFAAGAAAFLAGAAAFFEAGAAAFVAAGAAAFFTAGAATFFAAGAAGAAAFLAGAAAFFATGAATVLAGAAAFFAGAAAFLAGAFFAVAMVVFPLKLWVFHQWTKRLGTGYGHANSENRCFIAGQATMAMFLPWQIAINVTENNTGLRICFSRVPQWAKLANSATCPISTVRRLAELFNHEHISRFCHVRPVRCPQV